MEKKYLEAIEKQYIKDIKNIEEWEWRNIDSEVFPFYRKVLSFLFHKPAEVEHHYDSVKTDLYSFLHKICGSGDSLKDFVLSLQSFLSNAILDDSYFEIRWTKTWYNPENKFDFDINRRVDCDKNDLYGVPEVIWSGDGSQDIKLLEEALNIIIEREKNRYEKFEEVK